MTFFYSAKVQERPEFLLNQVRILVNKPSGSRMLRTMPAAPSAENCFLGREKYRLRKGLTYLTDWAE
jgi:hypothetical protein